MKTLSRLIKGSILAAMSLMAMPVVNAQTQTEKIDWGDYKLFIDPGHSGRENQGLWGYSEAEKVLAVALHIKEYLETYTTAVDGETLRLCRYDENTTVSLEERSDMANAWGADFFYAIHSDASGAGSQNSILGLFGGWRNEGVEIEKTPNGGKAFGEILLPNLAGVMRVASRGNWYDRCYYDRAPETHENQYPYLSVNRRTNMASILSEGGYHDIPEQQQRNINKDYKRLEAFAAFQTILLFRHLAVPMQTFITGVISNSENNQPINGATIKIGENTYTTDTYESVFNKYSRNPDLIHNGFFLFEGLEPGATLDYTVEAPGFEPKSGTVTVPNPVDLSSVKSEHYVAFLDVELTNAMPAVISSVSAEDLGNVSALEPLVLTFSRNMDRESVEKAFSIDNQGEVTLAWDNDYTLKIDVSKLEPYFTYNIKIDGSVAKNSQTGAFLDGDADGVAGGDYELSITMAEPDTESPYVISTYPAAEGEALYTQRPPIRLEFNEELAFNGDVHSECVTVKDAAGKVYSGTLSHAVVNGHSVLHFYTNEDLANDVAVLVTYDGTIPDLSANAGKDYAFRFLTEYRPVVDTKDILPLNSIEGLWTPGGSGSTSGIVNDESTITDFAAGPSLDNRTSVMINYVFDEYDAAGVYFIRNHYPSGNQNVTKNMDGVLTMWVYGDHSYNTAGLMLRFQSSNGLKYRDPEMKMDFAGWNLYVFDFVNDSFKNFTGDVEGTQGERYWYFDSLTIRHEAVDPDEADEENPVQLWVSSIGYNGVKYGHWDNTAERKAKLDDIPLPGDGIADIESDSQAPVEYFNLQGIRVDNPSAGIYIRRQGSTATKVVVK